MNLSGSSDSRSASSGRRRLLYVSDPSTIAINGLPDPVRQQDLCGWIDAVADSGADTFCQEVFSQGWTAYFRSQRPDCEYDQRRQHRRFLPLLEAGITPLEVLIDQAHGRGLRFLAGFRMNDDHAYQARQQGLGIARFIEDNPHLRLTRFPEGETYRMAEPLDFTFPEVRDFTFAIVDEVAGRFDVDGVELCFRDHAYFPPDAGPQQGHLMTDLLRRLRRMLDQRGAERGRGLSLGARVFSTVEECRHLGLDLPAWIAQGLVDHISPQDVMYCDFHLPVAQWAALTRPSRCQLLPALLPWTSIRARGRLGQIPLTPENCRAFAHAAYAAGADGLSVYNHFLGFWHAPFYPQRLYSLRQLADPEGVAAGERHYVFDPTWDRYAGFGGQGKTSTGAVRAARLTLDRSQPGARGEYHFPLYEDLSRAVGAALLLRGFGLTEADELEVRLNGHLIPDGAIRRSSQSDAPPEWDHARTAAQGAVRSIPEQGRVEFRSKPEAPFSTRWFALPGGAVREGDNCLSVALTGSDPGATGCIDIDEVEVWVTPR